MKRDRISRWQTGARVCGALFLMLAAVSAARGAEAVKVPPAVARAYEAARSAWDAGEYDGALAVLDEYAGDEHAYLLLMRGRILFDKDDYAGAIDAYTRCLKLDGARRDAGLGIINALIALDRYDEALPHCGRWIDVDKASSAELQMYAIVASRAEDKSLALQIAERGRLRFPKHEALRRILLSVLIDVEAYRDAELHLSDLLAREPGDRQLWRYFAALSQQTGDADSAAGRVALEAALLSNPDDTALREALVHSQLSARQVHAALANAGKLMQSASPSPRTIALSLHCALEAGEVKQARDWLDAIAPADRTRDMSRLAVRLALAEGDSARAREDIGLLLEAGDEDDRLLVQAGALDEKLARTASAEALYRTCIQAGGPTADSARLYLARLLLSLRRYDEATEQVREYLAAHPADQHAGRMLKVIVATQRAVSSGDESLAP